MTLLIDTKITIFISHQVHLSSQNEQQIRKMRYSASDIVLLNGNDKEERENESESDSSSSSSSSDETSDEEQNRDIVGMYQISKFFLFLKIENFNYYYFLLIYSLYQTLKIPLIISSIICQAE